MEPVITEEIIARQPPEAQAIIRALLAYIGTLKAESEQLRREVKGQTPQNSSLPPSTQHPHAKPQRPPTSQRKRGGQPGHPKYERRLIPTAACDQVEPLKPDACRRCGSRLAGHDPKPLRHQVRELPPIKAHVTEYQQHRLTCPRCGASTCAALPPGVPPGHSGPRRMAFTALLMAYYRQSKQRTAEFLRTVLGQPCSAALTVKIQDQLTAAVRPSYAALAACLPGEPQLNIDETATKEANGKAWLWTFVARRLNVFAVRPTREATALDAFLGPAFAGVVTCDRAKMYWQLDSLQWCWAHLQRDFQGMIDSGDRRAQYLGDRLRQATGALFEHWGKYRHEEISRAALRRRVAPVRRRIAALLHSGQQCGHTPTRGTCRELYEHRQRLWAFLRHEGVEPTNNAGERALRHAVIWRKLSFGTQSARGSRFVETMLTVVETCRQQERNAFAFLTQAVEAHLARTPAPSLLPGA